MRDLHRRVTGSAPQEQGGPVTSPDPAAVRALLLERLTRARDAGCPQAETLREQWMWRQGYNDALTLVGSAVWLAVFGDLDEAG